MKLVQNTKGDTKEVVVSTNIYFNISSITITTRVEHEYWYYSVIG